MRTVATVAGLLLGCSGGGQVGFVAMDAAVDARGGDAGDAGDAAPCVPSEVRVSHPELFDAIMSRSIADEPVEDGNWVNDFGDSTAYAPPTLTALALARCDPDVAELAEATLDWEKELVEEFDGHPDPEALIGALGLTEVYRQTPREDLADSATHILDLGFALLDLVEGYLPAQIMGDLPYGQTAATAVIVIVGLRYVEVVDPADTVRLERALRAIDDVAREAWDEEQGFYLYNEGDDRLELYPNVAMMAAHALAYRLTGDAFHLDRAEGLFERIQDLYLPDLGAYHSTYTSDAPDYVTLSSTNYLLVALQLLFEETGDVRYVETMDRVFEFVEARLWDPETRIAYHDWENGDRAFWYCAGCQFQLAYVFLLAGE